MPIYEYECEACGHSLDALQKLSDAPLKDCPSCGKATLRKRVSAPRFRLKGGGWYETDFKGGNRRNLAEGSDGSEKKSGGDKKSDEGGTATKESTASTAKAEKKAKDSSKDSSSSTGKSTASSTDN